jgi:hypothetical protein
VDSMPGPGPQNPPVLDWPRFLLSMLAGVLTVLVVWRLYSRRKMVRPEKKESKKKTGRKR